DRRGQGILFAGTILRQAHVLPAGAHLLSARGLPGDRGTGAVSVHASLLFRRGRRERASSSRRSSAAYAATAAFSIARTAVVRGGRWLHRRRAALNPAPSGLVSWRTGSVRMRAPRERNRCRCRKG